MAEHADIVVLGAGLAGLLCALELARAGVDVAVVDAQPTPWSQGSGASLNSLGLVQVATPEHPHRLHAALGQQRTQQYVDFSRASVRRLAENLPMERGGLRVFMGKEAQELSDAVAIAQHHGLQDLALSVEQASERLGHASPGPARWVEEDGRLDPAQALAHLHDLAVAAGCRFIPGTVEVIDGEGPLSLRGPGLSLQAELVVLAASHSLRTLVHWFHDKIFPVRHAGLLLDALLTPLTGASAQYGYLSWQADAQGRVRVSGARWATPHLETGEIDPTPAPQVRAALERFAGQLFPGAKVLGAFAGIAGHSCDNLPIVGPLPGGRLVACTGFGDSGWSTAAEAAHQCALGILGEPTQIPPFLQPVRFVG